MTDTEEMPKNRRGIATEAAKDNLDGVRQEAHTGRRSDALGLQETALPSEGDLSKIPAKVRADWMEAESFVSKHRNQLKKLMPNEADPMSFAHPETQDEVDTRFASINWQEYDHGRRTMNERTDSQKQQLSEFDRNLLNLLEQELLFKNTFTVNMLGEGLTRNAGKFKDLLQTFNKDLQAVGHSCTLKNGRFVIE